MIKHEDMYLYGKDGIGGMFGLCEKNFDNAVVTKPFKVDIKIFDGTKLEAFLCEVDFQFVKSYEKDGERVDEYINDSYNITVSVCNRFIENANVARCRTVIKNGSGREVRISKQSAIFASGIFGNVNKRNRQALKTHLIRSTWCGEGQVVSLDLDALHLTRMTSRDERVSRRILSRTGYTSEDFLPVVYFTDEEKKESWYLSLEPLGCWEVGLGILTEFGTDFQTVTAEVLTGSERENGYFVDIAPNEEYSSAYVAFGCCKGGIEEAVRQLNTYKRSLVQKGGGARQPMVFNDYLNCHWANPEEVRTKRLIDAASEIGAEVFCIDSGWYKKDGDDWFGSLGDWKENDKRFGEEGFQGIVNYIQGKGMKAGIWFELEVCTKSAEASNRPDDWFLMLNGKRIYEYERYFFDYRNEEVVQYLFSRIKRFYDMGVRYIKNDYNGTFAGCDGKDSDGIAGLEQHAKAVKVFYAKLRKELPDLMIENCSSGAMRADYTLLPECDLQSVSDLELFDRYPILLAGSLLSLLPEQTGVWSVCYPQVYENRDDENFANAEYREKMSDGEQTVFNMVAGFMGTLYLSGRIDVADEKNRGLVKEAVALYKAYRSFICTASPVYPIGFKHLSQYNGNYAFGLQNGERILLGVWHNGTENEIHIPAKEAKLVYPMGITTEYSVENGNLTVKFDKPCQARLFEIKK